MAPPFTYSNLSGRPTGPFLRTLGHLLPGVRAVQDEIAPYAAAWGRDNAAAVAAGTHGGPLWVALGDSMAQGIGASNHRHGYVGQLSDRLAPAWPHRLVNLSFNGARVQDVLDRQLPTLDALTGEEGPAALVTVVIGSNDIFVKRHRRHLVERFAAMLQGLPRGSVVANLPNPHAEALEIDRRLRAADARGEVVLADIRQYGPHDWRGKLAPDKFHPNDRGYSEMADVFSRALAQAGLPSAAAPGTAGRPS